MGDDVWRCVGTRLGGHPAGSAGVGREYSADPSRVGTGSQSRRGCGGASGHRHGGDPDAPHCGHSAEGPAVGRGPVRRSGCESPGSATIPTLARRDRTTMALDAWTPKRMRRRRRNRRLSMATLYSETRRRGRCRAIDVGVTVHQDERTCPLPSPGSAGRRRGQRVDPDGSRSRSLHAEGHLAIRRPRPIEARGRRVVPRRSARCWCRGR